MWFHRQINTASVARAILCAVQRLSRRAAVSRDLPMPGSPGSSTTYFAALCPRPATKQQFDFLLAATLHSAASRSPALWF
jgi:hypothetical protein